MVERRWSRQEVEVRLVDIRRKSLNTGRNSIMSSPMITASVNTSVVF